MFLACTPAVAASPGAATPAMATPAMALPSALYCTPLVFSTASLGDALHVTLARRTSRRDVVQSNHAVVTVSGIYSN